MVPYLMARFDLDVVPNWLLTQLLRLVRRLGGLIPHKKAIAIITAGRLP